MRIHLIIFIIYALPAYAQVDTTFLGLRGYEDLHGNTQLFYRMTSSYSVEYAPNEFYGESRGDIYAYNIIKKKDSLFLIDGIIFNTPFPATGQIVSDFEFTDSTLTDFYQCGDPLTSFEPLPIVIFNRDYNNWFDVNSFHGTTYNLEIAEFDTSINVYVYANNTPRGIFTQTDEWNFNLIESTENFYLISIKSASPNIWFVTDEDGILYKSLDTGNSFFSVDSTIERSYSADHLNRYFLYDQNDLNIYRVIQNYKSYKLMISDSLGESGTWREIFESANPIYISNDTENSGLLYFANDKNIYRSTNYGINYENYRTLKYEISGLYAKPNTDKIYCTTPHSILEITPDSIKVLKQLINYNALSYYPINIGDKKYFTVERDESFWHISDPKKTYQLIQTVLKDTVLNNNKRYFEIAETRGDTNLVNYYYERIDSINAKIYRYNELVEEDNEYVFLDLDLSLGDYFKTYLNFYGQTYFDSLQFIEVGSQKIFEGNDEKFETRVFSLTNSSWYFIQYYLSESIGISYHLNDVLDTHNETHYLNAAVINGKIYGDSTLVNIKSEGYKNISTSYSLSQNYPNPFNPLTVIRYQLPATVDALSNAEVPQTFNMVQNVSLKIYDILGREITTLVNENKKPGIYEVEFDGSDLSSGIYYYKLTAGNFSKTKKMILIK